MLAAIGGLEIGFIVFVSVMSGAAGIFSLYVLVQLFRNTGVRRTRSRP